MVALQGSLEDFALPDVLGLLASAKKTGELHVTGERGGGRLWLRDGEVVWTEAGDTTEPVDCLFELLRATRGEFQFRSDVAPPAEATPSPLDPLVAEATSRMSEWAEIEGVVPSLDTAVRLEPEAPGAQVVVSADQWRVLVAVAEEGTVAAVARALGTGEFGACRAVKELVDAGLVVVAGPAPAGDLDELVEIPRRRPEAGVGAPAPVPPAVGSHEDGGGDSDEEPPALVLPRRLAVRGGDEGEAELPSPAREAGPAEQAAAEQLVDENGEPINRSLLLKFLSSVRS